MITPPPARERVELLLDSGQVERARDAASRLSPLASQDARARRVLARLQFADESKGEDEEAKEWRHLEDAMKMMRGPHQS
jgi:hypothetical protein